MANFEIEEFQQFRKEASKASYEADNPKFETKEADGSTTLLYKSGDWKFRDNYFGGEPYGGHIIYSYKGKPVHITVFYGRVNDEENADEVYKFLRKALLQPSEEEFRGPAEFSQGELRYINHLQGNTENFFLTEKIFRGNKEIYSATFLGGLVDQRQGD